MLVKCFQGIIWLNCRTGLVNCAVTRNLLALLHLFALLGFCMLLSLACAGILLFHFFSMFVCGMLEVGQASAEYRADRWQTLSRPHCNQLLF